MGKVVFGFLLLFGSRLALGCSCPELSPFYLVEQAEFVYLGKVVKVQLDKNKGIQTTFEVLEIFKGRVDKKEVTYSRSIDCNIEFMIGHSYVVLANQDRKVSLCSGYEKVNNNESKKVESESILQYLSERKTESRCESEESKLK